MGTAVKPMVFQLRTVRPNTAGNAQAALMPTLHSHATILAACKRTFPALNFLCAWLRAPLLLSLILASLFTFLFPLLFS